MVWLREVQQRRMEVNRLEIHSEAMQQVRDREQADCIIRFANILEVLEYKNHS